MAADALATAVVEGGAEAVGRGVPLAYRTAMGLGEAPRVAQAAETLGVRPNIPMVAGGVPRTAINIMEQAPFTRHITEEYDRVAQELGQSANLMARRMGRYGTPQMAGATVQEGAERAGQRFAARRQQLDNAMMATVGANRPSDVSNSLSLAAELRSSMARAPGVAARRTTPTLSQVDNLLMSVDDQGRVPFDVLLEARREVGDLLDSPDVTGYTGGQQSNLRRLYGRLKEDVATAARRAGPEAERNLAVLDRYTRRMRSERIAQLDRLTRKNITPERAYQMAQAGTAQGDTNLSALRKSLTADEWDTLSSTVFHQMGLPTPSARETAELAGQQVAADFSPAKFLREWNKLSPEARNTLFNTPRYKGISTQIQALADLSKAYQRSMEGRNWSNTGRAVLGLGAVAGMATEPITTAGTLAGSYITSRLMAHPGTVKFLVNTARKPTSVRAPSWVGRVTGGLARLAAEAARTEDPELEQDLRRFIAAQQILLRDELREVE